MVLKAVIALSAIGLCSATYGMGPSERSLMFNLTFGPGTHSSTFADEEERFSEDYGFYAWYTNSEGRIDTVALEYSYLDLAADIGASWFLNKKIAFGLNYHYGNINQSIDLDEWNKSASLIDLHRIAVLVSYWPLIGDRFAFSGAMLAGPAFGSLHRFAVIEKNYKETDEMSAFLQMAHRQQKCAGFAAGTRLCLHIFMGDNGYLIAMGSYDFAAFSIRDNRLSGYPDSGTNHEFGVRFGFGFLTYTR